MHGTPFYVFALKEPNYSLLMMSTYGTLKKVGETRRRVVGQHQHLFRYPEVISNHYAYRDAVDNHNALRMDPISLEETWKTIRWPLRVFQFLLAITEVNCKLAKEHLYKGGEESQQSFRKKFANELIHNEYREQRVYSPIKRKVNNNPDIEHQLIPLPPYKNFNGSRIVKVKTRCVQRKCSCGATRCNTYCICSPGVFLCSSCFYAHVKDCLTS